MPSLEWRGERRRAAGVTRNGARTVFNGNFADGHGSLWLVFENANDVVGESFHLATMRDGHDAFVSIAEDLGSTRRG